jgi:hypothetical protein
MEGSITFWGYKEQESNLILPEHHDDEIRNVLEIVIHQGIAEREGAAAPGWQS